MNYISIKLVFKKKKGWLVFASQSVGPVLEDSRLEGKSSEGSFTVYLVGDAGSWLGIFVPLHMG